MSSRSFNRKKSSISKAPSDWVKRVKVEVMAGKDLVAMDRGGTSDPYCVVSLGAQREKTEIIYKTLDPVWQEGSFCFNVPAESADEELLFELYDHDNIGRDDRMGVVTLKLKKLPLLKPIDQWYEVKAAKAKDPVSGQIHLRVQQIPGTPAGQGDFETEARLVNNCFKAMAEDDVQTAQENIGKIMGKDYFIDFLTSADQSGWTPIHWAVQRNLDEQFLRHIICKDLIKKGLRFEQTTVDGNTPLHYFCAKFSSPECQEMFEQMVENGASINTLNSSNETALHKAILNTTIRGLLVRLCLDNGADPNLKTAGGETVLHWAVRLARADLVFDLVKSGADLTLRNETKKGERRDTIKSDTQDRNVTPLELALLELDGYDPSRDERDAHKDNQYEVYHSLLKYEALLTWLGEQGLSEYRAVFLRENWDLEDLPDKLNDAALDHMGINSAGHRLKIKKAVAELAKQFGGRPKAKKTEGAPKPPSQTETEAGKQMEEALLGLGVDPSNWIIKQNEVEFSKKLGEGAAGMVYRGVYKGRDVAVKVLKASDAQLVEEFKKECKIMSIARSPYLCLFVGAILEPKLCMILELCERGSLYSVLGDKELDISWPMGFSFMIQITKGLRDLHQKDIFHRDFKSLNVLVNKDWTCKVCDFGLSRLNESGNMQTLQQTRGTFAYTAPEVGKVAYTAAADVYSLGITLWEIIRRVVVGSYQQPFGEYPNLKMDFQILMAASQGKRPTLPEETPEILHDLYKQCVSAEAEKRPGTKDVVATLLTAQREAEETPYPRNIGKK